MVALARARGETCKQEGRPGSEAQGEPQLGPSREREGKSAIKRGMARRRGNAEARGGKRRRAKGARLVALARARGEPRCGG